MDRTCEQCGKHFNACPARIKIGHGRWCSFTCAGLGRRKPDSAMKTGYRGAGGTTKGEHVRVAESALGRSLPKGALVHHVNGNGLDNRPANLVICQDIAYHKLLHWRERQIRHGADPNVERYCTSCHRVKAFSEYYTPKFSWCKDCHRFAALARLRRKAEATSGAVR